MLIVTTFTMHKDVDHIYEFREKFSPKYNRNIILKISLINDTFYWNFRYCYRFDLVISAACNRQLILISNFYIKITRFFNHKIKIGSDKNIWSSKFKIVGLIKSNGRTSPINRPNGTNEVYIWKPNKRGPNFVIPCPHRRVANSHQLCLNIIMTQTPSMSWINQY